MSRKPGAGVSAEGVPGAGPRRKARPTEQAFIAAATDLFAEKGYNGTSIVDLATALGLTTASLYYHVNGKQDLLFRVLETGMADFLGRLEAVVAQDAEPREKLRLAVENHLDFVLSKQNAVKVFLRERRFLESDFRDHYQVRVDRYDQLFTALVRAGMDAGDVAPGDATLVRLGILGMINWVVEWYRPGGRLSEEQVRSGMTEMIMDRLLAPRAT